MSSGSSNIDPIEFNEIVPNGNNEADNVPPSEGEASQENQQAEVQSARPRSNNRRRRRRRNFRQPPPNDVQFRIWIYQQTNISLMSRQYMNRIMFAVGRCIRTQCSTPAQPGRAVPGITYRRNGNMVILDVKRDPYP